VCGLELCHEISQQTHGRRDADAAADQHRFLVVLQRETNAAIRAVEAQIEGTREERDGLFGTHARHVVVSQRVVTQRTIGELVDLMRPRVGAHVAHEERQLVVRRSRGDRVRMPLESRDARYVQEAVLSRLEGEFMAIDLDHCSTDLHSIHESVVQSSISNGIERGVGFTRSYQRLSLHRRERQESFGHVGAIGTHDAIESIQEDARQEIEQEPIGSPAETGDRVRDHEHQQHEEQEVRIVEDLKVIATHDLEGESEHHEQHQP